MISQHQLTLITLEIFQKNLIYYNKRLQHRLRNIALVMGTSSDCWCKIPSLMWSSNRICVRWRRDTFLARFSGFGIERLKKESPGTTGLSGSQPRSLPHVRRKYHVFSYLKIPVYLSTYELFCNFRESGERERERERETPLFLFIL